jgi:hypothetical protein
VYRYLYTYEHMYRSGSGETEAKASPLSEEQNGCCRSKLSTPRAHPSAIPGLSVYPSYPMATPTKVMAVPPKLDQQVLPTQRRDDRGAVRRNKQSVVGGLTLDNGQVIITQRLSAGGPLGALAHPRPGPGHAVPRRRAGGRRDRPRQVPAPLPPPLQPAQRRVADPRTFITPD